MGSLGRRSATVSDANALKSLLEGTKAKVLLSTDDGYTKAIERWSLAAIKPAGIALVPSSAEEVAIAVKYAAENGLDVAVRGGGHSTAGTSSTDGGLLIDLHSGMRDVKVDAVTKQLRVQGGCIWRDVNEAAWKHKLAVVGGGVDDTGVGGLTLGGGYGMLSPSQGLCIDQLLEVTVVLSSGEIVKASETQNSDLFWALRGAGPNFGVATEFVFQAWPLEQDPYVGTMLFAPTPENITAIVGWCNEMYEIRHTPEGPTSKEGGRMFTLLIIVKIPQVGDQTLILLVNTFDGPETEGKALLQPLSDLGPIMNTMAAQPYPVANQLAPTEPGLRVSQKGVAFKIPLREDFFKDMYQKLDEFTKEHGDAAKTGFAWEFFNPTKVVESDKGCYANRGWALNGLVMPQWYKAENDRICRQFARDISKDFKKALERKGETPARGIEGGAGVRGPKNAVMLYGNYDQYDEKSRDIFGDNYPRLQKLKARYDPNNVFDKLFPIQPAIKV